MLVKPITWIFGVVLTVVGIAGFVTGSPLLFFEVDPLHNVIHLASGIIAMLCAASGASYARMYLIIFGLVYGLVAVIGFAMGGEILGLMHVNMADNLLHTAIALVCLGVGFGSKK